jgi:hypothetical protein
MPKEKAKRQLIIDPARHAATTIIGLQEIGEDDLNLVSSVLVRFGRQDGARRGYSPKKRGRFSHHPCSPF